MRREIEGRPLLAASLALIIGISSAWHPLNILFFVGLLWLVMRNRIATISAALACLVGLLIAPARLSINTPDSTIFYQRANVVSVPIVNASGESCVVASNGRNYQLVVKDRHDLALGQKLIVYGSLRALHGEAGERLLLESAEASIHSRADDIRIEQDAPAIFRWSTEWRNTFLEMTERTLPADQAAVINALCFGTSGEVSPQIRRDLQNSGAVHLLTVSGLQVFLLAWLLQWILSLTPIPRIIQIAVIAFVLILYMCAAGLHPSILRASIMAIVTLIAYLFRREPDFLSALGLAAIVTLLWQPWSLFTPGFQLSFVSVAALSLTWRAAPFGDRKVIDKVAGRIWVLLRASVIVAIVSMPIIEFHYGIVPVLAPLSALLLAPAVPVLVVSAFLAFASSPITPLQVGILKVLVAPLASWLTFVPQMVGEQTWSAFAVPAFNAYWLLPYYVALLFLFDWSRRHR